MKSIKWLILCLFLTSCLGEGTDTGNPGGAAPTMGNGDHLLEGIGNYPGGGLRKRICLLINDCDGVLISDCETDLLTQTNIDTELGLLETDYTDLAAIEQAEENKNIEADITVLEVCLDDIDNLVCTDAGVSDAYDGALGNPYVGTAAIIPNSCSGIY